MTEQYKPRDITRLSYECLICGALVMDMSRHDEWHEHEIASAWATYFGELGDAE